MKFHRALRSTAVLLLTSASCFGVLACNAQNKSSQTTQQKLASLKELHDSGVLSDAEYQQKVASLKGSSPSSTRAASSGSTADAHVWHLKRDEETAPMKDWQTGQTRTIKMMNMLVPADWTMKLSASPNFAKIDCAGTSGRIQIDALSEDKSMGVMVIPTAASVSASNQRILQPQMQMMQGRVVFNCSMERPEPLAERLQQSATMIVPGAQVVGSMQPVPGLSASLPDIVAAANQNGSHVTAEAGRLRLSGSIHGKPAEMWLVAMQTERTEATAGGTITYTDLPMLAVLFAPPGQLDADDKLLMTVLSSIQIDPQWTENMQGYVANIYQSIEATNANINRIHQQMQQDNANAARQQQLIRNDAANYRNQAMSSIAANRSAALDHSSQQFALYMGDQAIYKDPATGQKVQMSSQYGHVWASTTGNTNDYILTDSASYDPNGKVGNAGWTQMEEQH
jgi:hypothetical protein